MVYDELDESKIQSERKENNTQDLPIVTTDCSFSLRVQRFSKENTSNRFLTRWNLLRRSIWISLTARLEEDVWVNTTFQEKDFNVHEEKSSTTSYRRFRQSRRNKHEASPRQDCIAINEQDTNEHDNSSFISCKKTDPHKYGSCKRRRE